MLRYLPVLLLALPATGLAQPAAGLPPHAGTFSTLSAVTTNTRPNGPPLANFVQIQNEKGGTPGYVIPNLRVQTNVNGNVGNYAWGINSILLSTATSGQHVAVAATARKLPGGTAEVWGIDVQGIDAMGGTSAKDGALVGEELDISANRADNYGTGIRAALDIVGSAYHGGPPATFGYGVRLNAGAGNAFLHGITLNGRYDDVGIDLSGATLAMGAPAIRLAAGQGIALSPNNRILSGAGGIDFSRHGVAFFQIGATGDATITNGSLNLGSGSGARGAPLASLNWTGLDSRSTRIAYASLRATIISNAHGAASGALASSVPLSVPALTNNGAHFVHVRRISGASTSTDAASAHDFLIAWDSTGAGARRETIPACSAAISGQVYVIKDEKGDAATANIIVAPAGGTIDGARQDIIDSNHGHLRLTCDGGSNWMAD